MMDGIISFIMGNPWVALVLAGIIIGMLLKSR